MNNFKKHCFKTILKLSVLGFISFNHFLHASSDDFNTTKKYIFTPDKIQSDEKNKEILELQNKIINALSSNDNFKKYKENIEKFDGPVQSFCNLFHMICENKQRYTFDTKEKSYDFKLSTDVNNNGTIAEENVGITFSDEHVHKCGLALRVTMDIVYYLKKMHNFEISTADIQTIYKNMIEKLDLWAKEIGALNDQGTSYIFGSLRVHSHIENSDSLKNQANQGIKTIAKSLSFIKPLKKYANKDFEFLIDNEHIKLNIYITKNGRYDINIKFSRANTNKKDNTVIFNRMYVKNPANIDTSYVGVKIIEAFNGLSEDKNNEILEKTRNLLRMYYEHYDHLKNDYFISVFKEQNQDIKSVVLRPIKPRYVDYSTILDSNLGDSTFDHNLGNPIFLHFIIDMGDSYIVAYSVIKNFGNEKLKFRHDRRPLPKTASNAKDIVYNEEKENDELNGITKAKYKQAGIAKIIQVKTNTEFYHNALYISRISKDKYNKDIKELISKYKIDEKNTLSDMQKNLFFIATKKPSTK